LLVGVVGYLSAHVLRHGDFFASDHAPHPAKEPLHSFQHGLIIFRVGEPAERDRLVERDRVG
jgi:hypothetical protein